MQEETISRLNALLALDPEGVSFMMGTPNRIKDAAVDLPFEFTTSPFKHMLFLFPLGLINGLLSEYDEAGRLVARVAAEYVEGSHIIKRFYVERFESDNG